MRKDMKTVITERPRIGGDGGKSYEPKGYKKQLDRAMREDDDSLNKFESNARHRKYGHNCKEFSERLGPLRKFLRSKVGQRWDDVWAEICENLRADNVVQNHVRTHVTWDVDTDVVLVDNKVQKITGGESWARFYVHPETGILCENTKSRKWRPKKPQQKFVPGKDEFHRYYLIDGIWYEVEVAKYTPNPKFPYIKKDAVLRTDGLIAEFLVVAFYGKNFFGVSKKQLNTKEIKNLKLWESEVGKNYLTQS